MTTITVQPAKLDLKLYAGDGFSMVVMFVDKATELPWPTTGTWTAQVRAPAKSSTILAEFNVTNDEAAGSVALALSGDQVRTVLSRSDASWDLQQHIDAAEPRTWYRGRISAIQDVTRP